MNYNNAEKAAVLSTIIEVLPQLEELDVGDCGSALTDSVMQKIIAYLPNLKVLKVCHSKITDRGLAGIEIDDLGSRPSASAIKRRSDIADPNNFSAPGLCLSRLTRKQINQTYLCEALIIK